MSVSPVVGRRLALGSWLVLALVACQGPDEFFRNDGSLSGAAGVGPAGAAGTAPVTPAPGEPAAA